MQSCSHVCYISRKKLLHGINDHAISFTTTFFDLKQVRIQASDHLMLCVIYLFIYFLAAVNQSLPTYESFNQSLFMVWAGYQDYFFDLYDGKLTPRQSLDTVPDVVTAITTALEVITLLGGALY